MNQTAINKRINKVMDIIHDLRKELLVNKKKVFIDMVVNAYGSLGIVFMAIQEYEAHGEYKYPLAHKYYKDLVFYLTYALKDNKTKKFEVYPTKAMKRYQKEKEKARRDAIEIQIKNMNRAQSWEEVNQTSDQLYRLGKRYGLIKEFRENGLL